MIAMLLPLGFGGMGLFDVTPMNSANNSVDSGLAYTEPVRNVCFRHAGFMQGANLSDFSVRKFGRAVSLAFRLPVLSVFICHVIGSCAKPEVRRIAAARSVAKMETLKSIGNRPIVKLIREAVGFDIPIDNPKTSVSIPVGTGSPKPTFVLAATVHLRPKSFCDRASVAIMPLYKPSGLPLNKPIPFVGFLGNGRFTTAATMTVAWFDFLRGFLREVKLELHKKSAFLCHGTGRLPRRGAAFIGCLQEYCTTLREKEHAL